MAEGLLTLTNLCSVYKAALGARKKYMQIGLELGLHPDDLENIKGDDNGARLYNVLTLWLQQPSLSPTWRNLVEALRARTVGREDIASRISNEYLRMESNSRISTGGSQLEPASMDNQITRSSSEGRAWEAGKLPGKLLQSLKASAAWHKFSTVVVLFAVFILVVAYLQQNYRPKSTMVIPEEFKSSELPDASKYSKSSISSLHLKHYTYSHCSFIGPNDLPHLPGPFVGRNDDMDNITKLLYGNDSWVRVVGMYGLPAVGKSWLAIHFGREIACHGIAVRYINLNDANLDSLFGNTHHYEDADSVVTEDRVATEAFGSDVAERDSSIGGFVHFSKEERKDKAIKQPYLLKWAKRVENHTLLILDNCDSLLERKLNGTLTALSQASPFLRVLTTSRYKVFLVDGFIGYHLKNLSDSSAVELLQLKSPISRDHAMTIGGLVGNLPLALSITAGLLVSRKVPVDRLITDLKKDPLVHEVRQVLDLSYKYIDTSTRDCSYYITTFPGSFSEDAVVAILNFTDSKTDPKVCLERLEELSLIEHYWYAGESRYQFHVLVKEFFKKPTDQFQPPPSHDMVLCSFGRYYSHSLLKFLNSHRSYQWYKDLEKVGRYECESHDYRSLLLVVNTSHSMANSMASCRKDVIRVVYKVVSSDINNLLLKLFTKGELGVLLRFYFTERLRKKSGSALNSRVSGPVYHTIRYPGRNVPSRQCERLETVYISPSKCSQLCGEYLQNFTNPFCLCLHRQPSELWQPVHYRDALAGCLTNTDAESFIDDDPLIHFPVCGWASEVIFPLNIMLQPHVLASVLLVVTLLLKWLFKLDSGLYIILGGTVIFLFVYIILSLYPLPRLQGIRQSSPFVLAFLLLLITIGVGLLFSVISVSQDYLGPRLPRSCMGSRILPVFGYTILITLFAFLAHIFSTPLLFLARVFDDPASCDTVVFLFYV